MVIEKESASSKSAVLSAKGFELKRLLGQNQVKFYCFQRVIAEGDRLSEYD